MARVELSFDVKVHKDCPPGQVYVVDPGALGTLAASPVGDVLTALGRKTVLCPDEQTAERIREAAKRVGRIDFEPASPEQEANDG